MPRKLSPDRQRLVLFLQQCERLLELQVSQIAADPRVAADTSIRVSAAWRDVKPRVSMTKRWVQRDAHALAQLVKVGLSGPQLDLKYHCFQRAYEDYLQAPGRAIAERLRVLRWTNRIMGGLATVAPGAEAVKDFKDALETVLEVG